MQSTYGILQHPEPDPYPCELARYIGVQSSSLCLLNIHSSNNPSQPQSLYNRVFRFRQNQTNNRNPFSLNNKPPQQPSTCVSLPSSLSSLLRLLLRPPWLLPLPLLVVSPTLPEHHDITITNTIQQLTPMAPSPLALAPALPPPALTVSPAPTVPSPSVPRPVSPVLSVPSPSSLPCKILETFQRCGMFMDGYGYGYGYGTRYTSLDVLVRA